MSCKHPHSWVLSGSRQGTVRPEQFWAPKNIPLYFHLLTLPSRAEVSMAKPKVASYEARSGVLYGFTASTRWRLFKIQPEPSKTMESLVDLVLWLFIWSSTTSEISRNHLGARHLHSGYDRSTGRRDGHRAGHCGHVGPSSPWALHL